jgi:protein-tyrosine phosphatase
VSGPTLGGIQNIISLGEQNSVYPPMRDVKYLRIVIKDEPTENIFQYFQPTFNFINEAHARGEKVLVHCMAGQSRSATIVIAYLMKHHAVHMQQALTYLQSKRPVVSPNPGFLEQLMIPW